MSQKDNLDGKEILTSLCDLARTIDSFETKENFQDLILQWCRTHMHPYQIDELFNEMTDEDFETAGFLAELASRDGMFLMDDFLRDLGRLYNAARFYIALDGVTMAEENNAYNLYQQGRFFESSPLFEKYKLRRPKLPDDFDVSKAGDDLVEIMKMENKYLAEHPVEQPPEGEFAEEPYDHFEELRNAMLEFFPDFKLRLKLNPRTNRIVLSADVNSVFEIAWYALAHLMTEEPLPEEKGKQVSRPEGMMTCCKNCGRFFIRRNYRNEYCELTECQKARNAKNQREFRDRQRTKKCRSYKE